MRRCLVTAAMCGLLALAATGAGAHESPYSYLDLRLSDGAIEGRLAAHVVDLAHEIDVLAPDSLLHPEFTRAHLIALRTMLARSLDVTIDGARIEPRWQGFEIAPDRRLVSFAFRATLDHPPGRIAVSGPLFRWEAQHETYVNVYQHGTLRLQDLIDRRHTEAGCFTNGRQGTWAVVRTFLGEGVHHIFLGPDHILFIVGLLLLGGSLSRLLKIVTGFTIAHSLTLALATLGLVRPPAHLVEPAIALSIVVVGLENLLARRRTRDLRAALAFGFGFIHGFGFASVLQAFGLPAGALGWSLLSFNLGVEIGQACIVLGIAPLLALARSRSPRFAGQVVTCGSVAVIAAGAFWLVQRVWFA